ncbi:hypothetical protein Ssi03_76900 [Sphaerisporangium siamense]|uniref:Conjugal transfer protein TraI n=1 Tax=Sphaerisporangium siamense TaxID=795645 RepID=A0A7W7DI31_9ACTN|nr:hypothetical protein [Sphaerisporangium siamense]MBB4706176.1 hypothetical protein [Sphaerisporangium siamense]GII89700.1 hypothetical protein Ssi03_76900 [Sphaerisporangium siamense]
MSITAIPSPEPGPDDVARGVAEVERYLAGHAPASSSTVPAAEVVELVGETKRVRELRAEVAEAHRLVELQEDEAPLLVDSPKVRKRRRAAHEAARLHELAQDPAARAWQAARTRRVLVAVAMVVLTLALGWSTAGVHAFASEGAPQWSPGWVLAWFVEPFLSLGLLFVVGARTYMATQGQPIVSPVLVRIEVVLLALTLGMNAWPHLPGVAEEFALTPLVLHLLGPIVAVIIVTALPIVLAAFHGLDHDRRPLLHPALHGDGDASPQASRRGSVAVADLRWRTPEESPSSESARGRTAEEHRAELHRLIASGDLPARPSARAIQNALRCREDLSRVLRDELRGGGA